VTYAERIKRARLAASLTQEQLARATGVASITVSRWERGKHEPLEHQYERLAKALGVEIEALTKPRSDET
jgi:transcriptional regulator with XRE-family HTH domain